MTNDEGTMIGLLEDFRDITEKHHDYELINRLSQAVEQSPSVIFITNPSGVIEYVNPKFTEVTGYSADEVIVVDPCVTVIVAVPVVDWIGIYGLHVY